MDSTRERSWAKAVYNYRWVPQTDPFGVVHPTIDYPGVPVDHSRIVENHNVLKGVRVPVRPPATPQYLYASYVRAGERTWSKFIGLDESAVAS